MTLLATVMEIREMFDSPRIIIPFAVICKSLWLQQAVILAICTAFDVYSYTSEASSLSMLAVATGGMSAPCIPEETPLALTESYKFLAVRRLARLASSNTLVIK